MKQVPGMALRLSLSLLSKELGKTVRGAANFVRHRRLYTDEASKVLIKLCRIGIITILVKISLRKDIDPAENLREDCDGAKKRPCHLDVGLRVPCRFEDGNIAYLTKINRLSV